MAATMLLAWELEDRGDLVVAAESDGDRTLANAVETAADVAGYQPRDLSPPPVDAVDLLWLDEERAIKALRKRLVALGPVLRPGETSSLQERLQSDLIPRGRIQALWADFERIGTRQFRRDLERSFEVQAFGRAAGSPRSMRAILLFSRDGRLLAGEGQSDPLDLKSLGALVARAEPGTSWSLAHKSGRIYGRLGGRAALVVVLGDKPAGDVGGTLKLSIASLERRVRVLDAPYTPAGHQALSAYLRAVRMLLLRHE